MNNLNETDAPVIVQPALDPEVDLAELDELRHSTAFSYTTFA